MAGYTLIDPPVGPYSSAADVRAWLESLDGLPGSKQVEEAREYAKRLLKDAERTQAGDEAVICAGILFMAGNKVLLLRRSDAERNRPGYWDLPGGHVEPGETPQQGAIREAAEEIGVLIGGDLSELSHTTGDVDYTTFLQQIKTPFIPELTGEHDGYVWAEPDSLPSPMIPELEQLLTKGAKDA